MALSQSVIASLSRARVVDMAAFLQLQERNAGSRVICKSLGISRSTAELLLIGRHWQQDPSRVRAYNEIRGTKIDPVTGIATAEDILAFGGLFTKAAPKGQGARDLQTVMEAAGHGRASGEVADRIAALEGGDLDPPARLDTQTFLQLTEERLWRALKLMTPDLIAKAGLRDLTTAVSMLLEKRQLLRGEPTAIVRTEQRGGLEKVAALLLAEAKRRGVPIEAEKGVDYREVETAS